MSSTISTTQIKTIQPRMVAKLKMEEKPARLVRTSSIEKIRRFNSFICSQHYFILPALFTWLKSSQSGLQSQTEKTIFLFRSIFFNTYFYKLFQMGFKYIKTANRKELQRQCIATASAIHLVISNFYHTFSKCFESTFVLTVIVYSATVIVISKLLLCVYLLSSVNVPSGLCFLILCISYINFMYFKMVKHYQFGNKSDTKNK